MKSMWKKTVVVCIGLVALTTYTNNADVASPWRKTADNFEVQRRVVFYNGITGDYMLTIEGLCSLGNSDKARELSVTCKVGPTEFKKHFLGLSDNVSYFVEQLEGSNVSTYFYRVVFKPSVIVPDVDYRS